MAIATPDPPRPQGAPVHAWPARRTKHYGVNVRLTLKSPSFVVPEK